MWMTKIVALYLKNILPNKMPKSLIVFILSFLVLLSLLFAQHQQQKENQVQQATPLINFSLLDTEGKSHSITEWQGKIRIINFWATWCPPCLKEIPSFIALQNEYAEKNLQFIGIAIDDRQLVEDYLAFSEINYPILMAELEGAQIAKQLGNTVNAIPYTVIVNQQNQIIFRQPGELSQQKIRRIIQPLFLK